MIWAKLAKAKKEKKELEYSFFMRVEGIMVNMSNIFTNN
jgi:hypothetical protein